MKRSNPRRSNSQAGQLSLAAIILLGWSSCTLQLCDLPDDGVVATFNGGELTRQEYADWRVFNGIDEHPEHEAAVIERAALTKALGVVADERKLDAEPLIEFTLVHGQNSVLFAALKRELNDSVTVTDDFVEEKLRENDARRTKPRRVQLRNIYKRVYPDATPEEREQARQRAGELRAKLIAGADFGELALAESDSQTKYRGGRMGIAKPGELPADLERVAFALEEGEVSQVLEAAHGFTLLRCEKVLPEETMSVEEARTIIRATLLRRERRAAAEGLRTEILGRAAPSYNLKLAATGPADAAVVSFNNGELTLQGFRWLQQSPGQRVDLQNLSSPRLRAVLEEYVVQTVGAQLARERGLVERQRVRAMLAWKRAQILSTELIRRKALKAFTAPTEAQLRTYIAEHPKRFSFHRQSLLSVIRMSAEGEQAGEQLRKAAQILESLRGEELSFAEAAHNHSDHPSAARGGALGWLEPRQIAQLGQGVSLTLETLAPGEVSELVHDQGQIWILELQDRRPERRQSFEEARERAEQELGAKSMRNLEVEAAARLSAELNLQVLGAE